MAYIVGKPCPGLKNRTGALLAAVVAMFFGAGLIVSAILSLLFANKQSLEKEDRRTDAAKEQLLCYYGAGFALWGVWEMLTLVMIFGIVVENKRALGFWLIYTAVIPLYFIFGLIYLLVTKNATGWEYAYLAIQGGCIIGLVWICLAIWVFMGEIRQRDKNPELRVDEFVRRKENEVMFAQPFAGIMPPAGSYNPGYGAPGGGSMSSIPRSQKSRHTYAPTEAGESIRMGSTAPRQSRIDQYRAQHGEKNPIKSDRSRSRSGEREGGPTYYRYQYTSDQKNAEAQQQQQQYGSQGSLGGRPAQPPQYQPARYNRAQPSQPPQRPAYGSQGSMGREAYQPQHHASQGSLGGRQPYQPQRHASQGSLGGRPQYQLQAQDNQYSKDSEV